jgi:hypothetical protein
MPPQKQDTIILVVLPENRRDLYYDFKDLLALRRGVPVQVVTDRTVTRVLQGDYRLVKLLALQIYTKLLKPKEAVWILENPCDETNSTLYVGFGYSRTPLTNKKANSFAALCDPRGRELRWQAIGIPFQGRYINKTWFRGFLKFVSKNLRENIDRVVVYRRGDTYEHESNTMISELETTKSPFKEDFHFISAINDIRRIYAYDDSWKNPEIGVFIVVNDKEAILVSSLQHAIQLRQGTIIPIRLIQNVGDEKMEKIVREYHDLSYLNWTAPITTSKYPLVLNIANKIAVMAKEQMSEELFHYFPS